MSCDLAWLFMRPSTFPLSLQPSLLCQLHFVIPSMSVIFHGFLSIYTLYHSSHISTPTMPQYMYKGLTCRQWKLNPAGCFDGSIHCKYSHVDTGIMSPPLGITCSSWKNGRCTLHENNCLFTHMDTQRPQSSFTFRSKCALHFLTSTIIKKLETIDTMEYRTSTHGLQYGHRQSRCGGWL